MYLSGLNPPQLQAVTTTGIPLLVLAGAGSGKTKVLTSRLLHLVTAEGIPQEQILALTFTNKAAGEMRTRLSALAKSMGQQVGKIKCSTFHSLGVEILREFAELIGYQNNFVIYDTGDRKEAIQNILKESTLPELEFFGEKEIIQAISGAKSRGLSPDLFLDDSQNIRSQIIGTVYQEYESVLRGCNAMDFDDLLIQTRALLQLQSDRIERLKLRYSHILIDEYQDTNRTQYEIAVALVQHSGLLFAVGDDDQSIYNWRGADPRNIQDFQRDFPQAQIIRLEQNYRSTASILSAANALICNNTQRFAKRLWTDRREDYPLRFYAGENEQDELDWLVRQIKAWRYQQQQPWREAAVLIRSKYQSRGIEEAMRNAGVPYTMPGNSSFFERRDVKHMLAYLKVLNNPNDEVSLQRIINSPPRGIGKQTIMHLMQMRSEGQSLFDVMKRLPPEPELKGIGLLSARRFAYRIASYKNQLQHKDFAKLAAQLFEEIGFLEEIERSEKSAEKREERKTIYHEFLNSMYLYCRNARREDTNSLHQFLLHIMLFESGDSKEERDGVHLMTVHSAKGLEFEWVGMVGLDDASFPHERSRADGGLEEERRLFYVAMTRAKKFLTLSYHKQRNYFGKRKPCRPSRFLEQISPDFMATGTHAVDKSVIAAESARKRNSFFRKLKFLEGE